MDYTGKVVLITGGSSGIGLALARQLAARSAFVCLAARRVELLQEALEAVEAQPEGGKLAFSVDVCCPEAVNELMENVTRQAGTPDILINSAGVTQPGYFQELGLETFHRLMDVNYFGTVHMIQAALPGMLQRGSGYIVNIASLAAKIGAFGYSAYSGSKFAVTGFSEVLRMELKPHGIRVSVVFPGDTDTPQLAYETPFKPPELKYLLPELGVVPVDAAARGILRGMERGRYAIYPDFGSYALATASRLLGGGTFALLDWLLRRSQRKIKKLSVNAAEEQ